MKKSGSILISLGAIYLVYLLISFFLDKLNAIKPEIAASIIAVLGSVFITMVSLAVTKHFENQAETLKGIRTKKIPIYQDVIRFFLRLLMGDKLSEGRQQNKKRWIFLKG